MDRQLIFYTDNRIDGTLLCKTVKHQLLYATDGIGIISVSLKPITFGYNFVLPLERGYLTMFKQILHGLQAATAEIVYLCEHDVLYSPSHFEFIPPDDGRVYYNTHVWHLRAEDGHALYYTAKRVSQICAYREVLVEHYRKRVELVEQNGFSYKMGFEPGTHRRKERVDDLKSGVWVSLYPNIDIKHGGNLTPARWSKDKFRNQESCQDWKESDYIPGWGQTAGRFSEFLEEILYAD